MLLRRKRPESTGGGPQEQRESPAPAGGSYEFRAVYDAHFALVWRTLQRFGVPRRDLEDATQEVFVVVHRRLAEFEGRSKLSTWLFSICMHVGTTRARRAHLRREVLDESPALELAQDPDCEHRLQRKRDLGRLQAMLDELDPGQRAVFCLYELEELTGEQIAELLELPLGTVYSRLRKARSLIERKLRFKAETAPALRVVKEHP